MTDEISIYRVCEEFFESVAIFFFPRLSYSLAREWKIIYSEGKNWRNKKKKKKNEKEGSKEGKE